MTDFILLKPYKGFPSLPSVGGDATSHAVVLREIRESVEQYARRRGDPLDSFVRLRELIDVGVLAQLGDRVVAADDTLFGGSVETEFVQDTIGTILLDSSSINFTYNDSAPSITATVIAAGVDHNLLANYVANEHVDHTTVVITAGVGLDGGGDISASFTLDLDAAAQAALALAATAVQPARQVIAGAGLTGGGDLSADRTFDVGAGTGITVNANDVALSPASIASLALADTAVQPGDVTTLAALSLTAVATPAVLAAGDNDDFAVTGIANVSRVRLQGDAGGSNLTGLTGGTDGKLLVLTNISANAITIVNEDGGSTAANRFAMNGDHLLLQNCSVMFIYDDNIDRWTRLS